MKKFRILFVWGIVGVLLLPEMGVLAREIHPDAAPEPETLIISGHDRRYYRLSRDQNLTYSLEGPQRIRVITRVVIDDNQDQKDYRIEYTVDDGTPRQFTADTEISPVVKHSIHSSERIGKSRSLYITIPPGKHTYKFHPAPGTDMTVYVRVLAAKMQTDAGDDPEMVHLRPSGNAERVKLLYKETPLTYYRLTDKTHAEVTVNGQTYLRLYTRVEFEYWMEGEVNYRITVMEDSKVKGTFQLSSDRSETTIYQDNGELIPGKWRRFKVGVPDGEHTYRFTMSDSEKSALIKILLPENGHNRE